MAGKLVSLTFDAPNPAERDAILNRIGLLPVTFFVDEAHFVHDMVGWLEAEAAGHEIGNGCLLEGASQTGELPNWSLHAVEETITDSQKLLTFATTSKELPFGYPRGLPLCADGTYEPIVERHFLVARTAILGYNDPSGSPQRLRSVPAEELDRQHFLASEAPWLVIRFGPEPPAENLLSWVLDVARPVTLIPGAALIFQVS